MSTSKEDILKLPVAERLQLVGDIWDSIVADAPTSIGVTEAQRHELRRRLAEHDADPASAIPWAKVRDELLPGDE